ncbi:MAG: pyruvate dehydrogenase (acetyl-transferring) E1 component subunit alpha [Pseudomonadota bacterium]|nr:pyruvate dehydrogenase (acetyl-transferring) E1 component subunit alpha [Pseudomonadota bacterium]
MFETINKFEVKYLQILDEFGKLKNNCDYKISKESIFDLYKIIIKTRLLDKKAFLLQRTGRLGTYPSSYGQEAVFAVIGYLMGQNDILCPHYRDQAALIQRGVKLEEILAYWGGDERGNNFENNKHDFPIAVPIASQCLHAVGAAYSLKYKNEKRVVVTTLGDGGTSKGDFFEAMNFASIHKLPVIFVINNNKWAISVPLSKQTNSATLAQKAIAAGIDNMKVDGNDVFALHYALNSALEKAYNNEGPTVIEAETFRLCDHTTADDATKYMPAADLDNARQKEPLVRLDKYLKANHSWNDEKKQQLEDKLQEEIMVAADNYLNTPPQEARSMFESLYQSIPESLKEQYQGLTGEHE